MHHSRRKSGHASTNSSTTDVRKAVTTSDLSKPRRPQTLSRKSTPQVVHKLGKNPRDREREWEEERFFEDERESFPQFWYVYYALLRMISMLGEPCLPSSYFGVLPKRHVAPGKGEIGFPISLSLRRERRPFRQAAWAASPFARAMRVINSWGVSCNQTNCSCSTPTAFYYVLLCTAC